MRRPRGRKELLGALAVAAAVVAGLMLRIWTARARAGTIDSDVAVIGLMARHVAKGQFPVFHWGQAYAGSHEALLAGAVFLATGPSAFVLKLVTIALSGGAALLIWLLGLQTVGRRPATVAALLFWLWPAGAVWWSVKPGSDYWGALCLTLGAVVVLVWLSTARLHHLAWFGVAGLLAGMAWWGNPQSMALLVPVAIWAAPFLARNWRRLPLVVGGAVVGMAPWLAFNVRNGWISFDLPASTETYGQRLWGFLHTNGPMLAGMRVPYTYAWLVPQWGYWLLLAGLIAVIVRRPAGSGFVVLAAILGPFVLALSPLSSYTAQPRYLLFLLPAVCLLLGVLLARPWPWLAAAGLGAAFVLTIAGLARLDRPGVTAPFGPDVAVPADIGDLKALLADHDVRFAFGDYWLAYRTTFETNEHVLVEPLYVHRYRPIERAVRAAPLPAYVFVTTSRTYTGFVSWCTTTGRGCQVFERGQFALVLPAVHVDPEHYPGSWFGT